MYVFRTTRIIKGIKYICHVRENHLDFSSLVMKDQMNSNVEWAQLIFSERKEYARSQVP